jgi:hypothetical protein
MTLSHCPELRELEFSGSDPTEDHRATVTSITSLNFRKIKISRPSIAATLRALINDTCWISFDDCISALADKLRGLGNIEPLELEFQIGRLVVDPLADYNGFLPKFREKGRVRIVECSGR